MKPVNLYNSVTMPIVFEDSVSRKILNKLSTPPIFGETYILEKDNYTDVVCYGGFVTLALVEVRDKVWRNK